MMRQTAWGHCSEKSREIEGGGKSKSKTYFRGSTIVKIDGEGIGHAVMPLGRGANLNNAKDNSFQARFKIGQRKKCWSRKQAQGAKPKQGARETLTGREWKKWLVLRDGRKKTIPLMRGTLRGFSTKEPAVLFNRLLRGLNRKGGPGERKQKRQEKGLGG